jgi:hypothetical protein
MFSPDGSTGSPSPRTATQGRPGETDVYRRALGGGCARGCEIVGARRGGPLRRPTWPGSPTTPAKGRGVGTAGPRGEPALVRGERFRAIGLEPAAAGQEPTGSAVPSARLVPGLRGARRGRKSGRPRRWRSTAGRWRPRSCGRRPSPPRRLPARRPPRWWLRRLRHHRARAGAIDDYRGRRGRTGRSSSSAGSCPRRSRSRTRRVERRYGDLRYKAWNAREHGAVGLIVADLAAVAEVSSDDSAAGRAPPLRSPLDGIATAAATPAFRWWCCAGEAGARFFEGGRRALAGGRPRTARRSRRRSTSSAVLPGRVGGRLPESAVLVGAHYDHLGRGGLELARAGRDARSTTARTTTPRAPRRCWRARGSSPPGGASCGATSVFAAFSAEELRHAGLDRLVTREPPQGLEPARLAWSPC